MEQDIDGEEKARGQLTGELRIKKTQHMTTSRYIFIYVYCILKNREIMIMVKCSFFCIFSFCPVLKDQKLSIAVYCQVKSPNRKSLESLI